MLPSTLPAVSDQDRLLVTTFRSPVTAAPFEASIPGSKFLACYFAPYRLSTLPVRIFGSITVSGLLQLTATSLPQSRCNASMRFARLP